MATEPTSVTGVQLMQGIGVRTNRGFWAEAWSEVLAKPRAVAALAWIGLVALMAVLAPVLASGHPLMVRTSAAGGQETSWPLLASLSSGDVLLLVGGLCGALLIAVPWPGWMGLTGGKKLTLVATAVVQGGITVTIAAAVRGYTEQREIDPAIIKLAASPAFVPVASVLAAVIAALPLLLVATFRSLLGRGLYCGVVAAVAAGCLMTTWKVPPAIFDYRDREKSGTIQATYTLVPFSPSQRDTSLPLLAPGTDPLSPSRDGMVKAELGKLYRAAEEQAKDKIAAARTEAMNAAKTAGKTDRGQERAGTDAELQARREVRAEVDAKHKDRLKAEAETAFPPEGQPTFVMGTDAIGQDVMSQMLHACRLSISIGLVSTGIAVLIGITIGSIMGYFGGWIDTILFRVVEVFMAIPVLFLLVVAAAVLPRNTYVMMGIIGCVTWTGAARFTRAEFMRLRNQDFVQAAQAAGLPLRSVLFKHMLPNGITPVLVDASFAIAAAIQFEAILSFLALGPAEQASWGRLLSSAIDGVGEFKWWLAMFPGMAIFLTALSYNTLGECLRDAIDPKLKKARV